MTKEKTEIKPPFYVDMAMYPPCEKGEHYIAQNRFTGQQAELTPLATAVYDMIISAEMLATDLGKNDEHEDATQECWDIVRKGLDWFREHYAEEYMILLD